MKRKMEKKDVTTLNMGLRIRMMKYTGRSETASMAKRKTQKIKEVPRSGSKRINVTGRIVIPNDLISISQSPMFGFDISFANSNKVVILAISEGCRLKGPKAIQR
jgi:hypothetical protein